MIKEVFLLSQVVPDFKAHNGIVSDSEGLCPKKYSCVYCGQNSVYKTQTPVSQLLPPLTSVWLKTGLGARHERWVSRIQELEISCKHKWLFELPISGFDGGGEQHFQC